MRKLASSLSFLLSVMLIGCASAPGPLSQRNSQLTTGNVQLNLTVGTTTKAGVLENFGSPNIVTRDGSDREIWSYQQAAQVSQSSSKSGFWTIVLFGESRKASGFETSSRMTTLIIIFDSNDVVVDFKSRTSNF